MLKIESFILTTIKLMIKDFNVSVLKVDKKDYKEIDNYYIGYVTLKKIANYNNINSVNPFHLKINEMIGSRW